MGWCSNKHADYCTSCITVAPNVFTYPCFPWAVKKTCAPTDFTCQNGQCIPARWLCDGEAECSDGSDEAGSTCNLLNKRVYWVDSKLHLISSVDFSGGSRKVLLSSPHHLAHPFALTVFEDRVYWTDLENEAIYSASRLTGHNVSTLAEHLNNPHDIVVFHELRQPKAPDSCNVGSVPNGGCEYLCLPAPQISEHSPKYTCACADGMELHPDMRHCQTAVLVGVMCTGGYLIWRNWRRKNTKSMNFDNPVYRKTTEEEEEEEEIHIGRTEQIGHVYPAVSARTPATAFPDNAAHCHSTQGALPGA
ncbi:UNVERIFIED_CONTAM: hypothetical protein FKN15_030080 [Acipenser sinensis]